MVPAVDGLFDSAWLKWGWAVVHAQAFQAELSEHAASVDPEGIVTSRTEYDPKRHCIILRVDTLQPPPPRWGLRLGDVASNFRGSLDHLAWALVQRGTKWPLPKRREGDVYFPFADSRERFDDLVAEKLPGLLRADKAIIRRYQPYYRGKRNLPLHCLTPIPGMTRDDKHRRVRPVWSAPEGGKLVYGPPEDCEITRITLATPRLILDLDAEIKRIYVRKTGPNPDIYMEADLTIKPVIDGPLWLDNWLAVTTHHIHSLLREFSEPPEELLTLGIIPTNQGGIAPG